MARSGANRTSLASVHTRKRQVPINNYRTEMKENRVNFLLRLGNYMRGENRNPRIDADAEIEKLGWGFDLHMHDDGKNLERKKRHGTYLSTW